MELGYALSSEEHASRDQDGFFDFYERKVLPWAAQLLLPQTREETRA